MTLAYTIIYVCFKPRFTKLRALTGPVAVGGHEVESVITTRVVAIGRNRP